MNNYNFSINNMNNDNTNEEYFYYSLIFISDYHISIDENKSAKYFNETLNELINELVILTNISNSSNYYYEINTENNELIGKKIII